MELEIAEMICEQIGDCTFWICFWLGVIFLNSWWDRAEKILKRIIN